MSGAAPSAGEAGGPDWRAVLFDLDGTLADSVPLILRCYRHTMKMHRGREMPDDLWVPSIGQPLKVSMARFAADVAETERMIATYIEFQRGVHDEMVRSFPGAVETLGALRARGVRVGVVTSKGREMTGRTLASCGLDGLVEVLVTADDVKLGKPDPEPVLRALGELGLEPRRDEVLFVGDSPHDLVAGRAAGVRTGAALWGPFARSALAEAAPDHWLEALEAVCGLRPGDGVEGPPPHG